MGPLLPRVRFRLPFLVLAVVCFALFLGSPMGVAVAVLLLAPLSVGVWLALCCLGFVAALGYALSSSYQWVELQSDVIRGRKLLTWRFVEGPVADVVRVTPLHSAAMGPLANAALETSDRGYELRFRDGLKMGLLRGDMAGRDPFTAVLRERLGERWAAVCGHQPCRPPVAPPQAARAILSAENAADGKKYKPLPAGCAGPIACFAHTAKGCRTLRLPVRFARGVGTGSASLVLTKHPVGSAPPDPLRIPHSLSPRPTIRAGGSPQPPASSFFPRPTAQQTQPMHGPDGMSQAPASGWAESPRFRAPFRPGC